MGRLVILSGPSCVGKGPLHRALKVFYPQPAGKLTKLVLYDSRPPRPGEIGGVDYHFRTREYIEQLRNKDDFLVTDVRGDLQALDLNYFQQTLDRGDALFEGNPFIGTELLTVIKKQKITCLSVFLSPLSKAEIEELKAHQDINPEPLLVQGNLETLVTDIMRRKLLRRTTKQKSILSLPDLENIEVRAASAYKEMKQAWRFDYVIPNHDGEDSENWDAFSFPIGDARATLMCFVEILNSRNPAYAEHWPEGLLP
jgi:guanylate kinase